MDGGVAEANAAGGYGLAHVDRAGDWHFLVDNARRTAGGCLHLGDDHVADVVLLQIEDVVGGQRVDLSRRPDLVDDHRIGHALASQHSDLLDAALLRLNGGLVVCRAASLSVCHRLVVRAAGERAGDGPDPGADNGARGPRTAGGLGNQVAGRGTGPCADLSARALARPAAREEERRQHGQGEQVATNPPRILRLLCDLHKTYPLASLPELPVRRAAGTVRPADTKRTTPGSTATSWRRRLGRPVSTFPPRRGAAKKKAAFPVSFFGSRSPFHETILQALPERGRRRVSVLPAFSGRRARASATARRLEEGPHGRGRHGVPPG